MGVGAVDAAVLPVMVVIDGSTGASAVADWAAAEAGRRGAPLCLVHPLPRPVA
ncbi:universal stress protein, partial [Kitasatospora sp. NPDC085879]|uniref:universal stress protein n=1 Tax=Kitasatospora sp. NPDC085879 TaxID=3154769 RepID=UPI003434FEB7